MGVLVRPCTPDDLPAVTAIYREAVEKGLASWEYDAPSLEEMTRRRDGLVAGGYPYLAADLDGALAGYAYAGPFRTRAAYDWTVENSVYVAPGAQRRGIARALMAELIAICTARGHRQMLAVIGDSGTGASVPFHKSLGFTHMGTMPALGWKQGRWLDLDIMQLALGEGSSTPPGRLARDQETR